MFQVITLNQLKVFWNGVWRRTQPKRAKATQSVIQDMLRKYIKKEMIHGGKGERKELRSNECVTERP